MNHEEIQLNLPLWAADEVPPELRHEVSDHLAACEECRAAWDDYRAILTSMEPGPVEPDWSGHEPLRQAFAARLAATSPGKFRPSSIRWIGWAAAAILAMSGWGLAYRFHQEATQKETVLALMSQGHVVELTSPVRSPYHAVLVVHGRQAVIWADHLPSLPSGHIYEGWWVIGGRPQPAGLFGNRPVVLTGRPPQATEFAVTVEPAGGTRMPTTPVLVAGSVQ
ncbi:hypothetical protein TPY_1987 [Sulfobacillus acidophilus TPY]|uniref:Anti-sigma-W factor RsiW n=1 Tax=Sulfobacillus acidophilus (strain ATCC 700253 / DSM 10332 / NAL) TaxID=679936 RepID=G8TTJ3_SULAD|nr:hypothetical protein TPY_1987 [Sulfobacillus acidophilus TPY]AEW05659.1 Anti-sigma-K factor RskA [Sulfobacillus acidophilus DSM 10332]